jgi:hypothetical protein
MARKTRKPKPSQRPRLAASPAGLIDIDSSRSPIGQSNTSDASQRPDDRSEVRGPVNSQSNQRSSLETHDRSLAEAVGTNTALLEQVLSHVLSLRDDFDQVRQGTVCESAQGESASQAEYRQLRERIEELENEVGELEQQNHDLAAQVASSTVRQSVSAATSSCHEALSWDERKRLILQQMEQDSFDGDAFVSSLSGKHARQTGVESPIEFFQRVCADLESRDSELERRDEELRELRFLLEQQAETRAGGVAIGAAAIAQVIDSDELVQQERSRLQQLQAEWQEKFRQGEIEASLERAKLSRERQQLAKKQAELEEQLEHLRRESRQVQEIGSGTSRRWMAKLGLSDKNP